MNDSSCQPCTQAWPVFLKSCVMLMDLLDRELQAQAGVALSWYDVLAQLYNSKNKKLPMKQLADSVLLSKSGLTRLVDRMVQAGLIRRDSCPTDRRIVYAAVTPKGEAVYRKASPVAVRGVQQNFASYLSDQEASLLMMTLSRVLEAAEARRAAAMRLSPL